MHSPSRPDIETASCISRDILSLARNKMVVNATSHLHLPLCAARFPTVMTCWQAYLCSRSLSWIHRPDCPMQKRPQDKGILYTTPCAQFTNLRTCRTLHFALDAPFSFPNCEALQKPPSFKGAVKTTGTLCFPPTFF